MVPLALMIFINSFQMTRSQNVIIVALHISLTNIKVVKKNSQDIRWGREQS